MGARISGLLLYFFFSQKEPKKKQQLSICNKLCYAVGGAPYQMTGCALGFFLQIYLLDVAQVSGLSTPGFPQLPRFPPSVEWGWESLLCRLSESHWMRNTALGSIQNGSLYAPGVMAGKVRQLLLVWQEQQSLEG